MNHSILIADDDDSIRFVLTKALQKKGYRILTARSGKETINCLRTESVDVIFLDILFPDANGLELMQQIQQLNKTASVIVITAHGTTQTAIEAAKRRAYDYITKPFDINTVIDLASRAIYAANQAKAATEITSDTDAAATQPSITEVETHIVGESPAMHAVYQIIGRAAVSDETVLIMGESGTGKELVAKLIHHHSQRADKELVVVDCSAIPPTLIESALFEHVKGAFTGGEAPRQGKFEQADGSTIFLDEVGELPIDVQMKLLRVLQEREVEPVGSNQKQRIDVRVIAATNRHLEQSVQDGLFREDLYYRLNVIPIYLPPLHERPEDIPELIDLFITRFAQSYQRPKTTLSSEALQQLMDYHWPGNVRELENTVKRALVMCTGSVVLPEHLPQLSGDRVIFGASEESIPLEERLYPLLCQQVDQYMAVAPSDAGSGKNRTPLRVGGGTEGKNGDGTLYAEVRAAFERPLFKIVLERTGWNRSKAAEILGINRNTLHSKIEEYKIQH